VLWDTLYIFPVFYFRPYAALRRADKLRSNIPQTVRFATLNMPTIFFRCSILKACFTAVFPSLVRLQQAKNPSSYPKQDMMTGASMIDIVPDSPLSSGQSTPTRGRLGIELLSHGDSQLKAILDKLLSLVTALLLQELRQSTLDEIFTLLEPYLKLSEKLSREMAITILHATLRTFYDKRFNPLQETVEPQLSDEVDDPASFSPGPYIIGSLVPRCFDTSRHVQSTALTCLQLLVIQLKTTCKSYDRVLGCPPGIRTKGMAATFTLIVLHHMYFG
jgi:hypothetical protein